MMKTFPAALAALFVLSPSPRVEAQADGPCALLTTAEVQQAFAGSKPGRVDRSLEKDGILRCVWDHPAGTLMVIDGREITESPREEASGWTLTFLDPLRDDAERRVRYEALPGVGDEAVAVVERKDPAKGFAQDGAILVLRRGKRQVSVLSNDLAKRERAEALGVLATLGKAIAKRLG
jgi:hypothetical protein